MGREVGERIGHAVIVPEPLPHMLCFGAFGGDLFI